MSARIRGRAHLSAVRHVCSPAACGQVLRSTQASGLGMIKASPNVERETPERAERSPLLPAVRRVRMRGLRRSRLFLERQSLAARQFPQAMVGRGSSFTFDHHSTLQNRIIAEEQGCFGARVPSLHAAPILCRRLCARSVVVRTLTATCGRSSSPSFRPARACGRAHSRGAKHGAVRFCN